MSEELRARAREVWAVEGAIRYREQALEIVTLSSEKRAEHERQLAGYLKRLAGLLQPKDAEPVGGTLRREDVELLRSVTPNHEGMGGEEPVCARLDDLADRIEARLDAEAVAWEITAMTGLKRVVNTEITARAAEGRGLAVRPLIYADTSPPE